MRRGWGLTLLLPLALSLPCCALAALPAISYRITGVVINQRDGAPVPRCRITAAVVPASQLASARPVAVGQRGPARGPGSSPNMPPNMPPNMGRGAGGSRPAARSNQPPETTADASGRFTLELPRAGAWMLTAYAHGFRGQNYDEHDGFFSAVVLTEAEPVFSLTYRLTPDSVLTGLVVDEAGDPVLSAQVMVETVPEAGPGIPALAQQRPVQATLTDDRGRYEIGGLPSGRYRLRVDAQPWYAADSRMSRIVFVTGSGNQAAPTPPPPDPSLDLVYATTWFPGVDDAAAAETIALGPGEERQADFHLTAIPAVHLRIPRTEPPPPPETANPRGRPLPMRPILVTPVSNQSGFNRMIQGNQNGAEVDFGGLAPGTYEVRFPGPDGRGNGEVRQIVVHPGSQPVITMEDSKPLVQVTVRTEGASDGDNLMIEFVDTETGRRIESTPQFRGRRGGLAGLVDSDEGDDTPEEVQTPARSVMLAPHTYQVSVGGGSGAYITGLSAKGAQVTGREVKIEGAATLTLRVAKAHAAIDGVARIGSTPAQGAMMLLVPATLGEPGDLGTILREETNTDGTFAIGGIVPGKYILVAIDHGWNVSWQRPEVLRQYLLHGTPVDLQYASKAHEELEAQSP